MQVRQRRSKKSEHKPQTESVSVSPDPREKQRYVPTSRQRKSIGLLLAVIYVPFLILFNPSTIRLWYYRLSRKPCQGVCSLEDSQEEEESCTPADPTRLVFVRIPKTATTTVLSVMKRGFERKSVVLIDLGELEDLVPSIASPSATFETMGYHNVLKYKERVAWFYERASNMIVSPPYYAQDRTLFEGHLHYFNFVKNAPRLVRPPPWYYSRLPEWILEWYQIQREPQPLDDLQQISFVRHPHSRLKSMYYYDRHDARTSVWRDELVKQRGNATMEECLLDPTCIEKNELSKWCSIQVEMLCGVGKSCHPVTTASLEIAKTNLRDNMLLVGVAERMDESLLLLQHLLPTYLEGVSLEEIPQKKTSSHISRRESSFSTQAKAILEEMCSMDLELYNYANEILTERLQTCR